jgi:hypothetical protein
MPASASNALAQWGQDWLKAATFTSRVHDDIDGAIERILECWKRDLPDGWEQDVDAVPVGQERYRRVHKQGAARPQSEHEIESLVLGDLAEPIPADRWAGLELIDGLNAVPLCADPGGDRAGNVEADLLLLVRDGDAWGQRLVEVKSSSTNAFYAVAENLRQLRLFQGSTAAQTLFHDRGTAPAGQPLPVEGAVLAPRRFYESAGQKRNGADYARSLLAAIEADPDVDARITLAAWTGSRIQPYGSRA